MAALIKAAAEPTYPAEIVLVISNCPDAIGLEFAKAAGVPTAVIDHRRFGSDRRKFECEIQAILESYGVQFICLAGFMRLLTPGFVSQWENKILNIHPALLPAFKGLHTHERAIAANALIHGASVHFVIPEMDSGPILARVPIHIRQNDTPETLGSRVLKIEHRIYPAALKLVAQGRVTIDGDHCFVDGRKINGRVLFYIHDNKKVVLKGPKAFKFINMSRKQAAA
jgi:phosphoribosylglycinamide formyltransferase-1